MLTISRTYRSRTSLPLQKHFCLITFCLLEICIYLKYSASAQLFYPQTTDSLITHICEAQTNLPHRFDALLEEVEVTVSREVTRPYQMAVELPELLHLSNIN